MCMYADCRIAEISASPNAPSKLPSLQPRFSFLRYVQGEPILCGNIEVSIGFLLEHESLTQVPPLPKFVGPLEL